MAEEKNFENRVKQWLRSKGCYVVKYYGCGVQWRKQREAKL